MAAQQRNFHEAIQEAGRQRPSEPTRPSAMRTPAPGFQALRQPLIWALLMLAFALGRLSVDTGPPRASQPSSPGTSAPGGQENGAPLPRFDPTGSLGGAALVEMERSLHDPANHFSVLAVTYARTPRNQRWAQDYVSYFAGQDLPVAPPQAVDDLILVLVGASPDREGLKDLLGRVRSTPDVGGRQGAFASAYIVDIDEQLRRR